VEQALAVGAITRDAIAQFLFPREDWRFTAFSLEGYPHLRQVCVAAPKIRNTGNCWEVCDEQRPSVLLLEHHLKALKLPTLLRDYASLAAVCAQERCDYPQYLLRLTERELIDRERRATERRIKDAQFPSSRPLTLLTSGAALGQRADGAGVVGL